MAAAVNTCSYPATGNCRKKLNSRRTSAGGMKDRRRGKRNERISFYYAELAGADLNGSVRIMSIHRVMVGADLAIGVDSVVARFVNRVFAAGVSIRVIRGVVMLVPNLDWCCNKRVQAYNEGCYKCPVCMFCSQMVFALLLQI